VLLCAVAVTSDIASAVDGEVERQLHILLLGGGSRGDVQPAISVAATMKGRGARCTMLAGPEFEDLVHNTGCNFIPGNANFKELMTTNDELIDAFNSKDINRVVNVMGREADDTENVNLRRLQELMDSDPVDACIATSIQWSSSLLMAEMYGIPAYGMLLQLSHFEPDNLSSFFDPGNDSGFLETKEKHWDIYRVVLESFFESIDESLQRARRDLFGKDDHHIGIRDITAFVNGVHPHVHTIFPCSPSVFEVPEHINAVGFSFPPSMEEGDRYFGASQELQDFISNGETPLYIGWGSMCTGFANSPKLTRIVLEATRQTKNRAVVLSGWQGLDVEMVKDDEDLYSWAQENTIFLKQVPQDYVFSRAKAIVIHGGAGTTAQALRSGRPIVVSPYLFDQPWWGYHVERLGCGVITDNLLDITTEVLAGAIERVTSDAAMVENAKRAAAGIAKEQGNERIADILMNAMREYREGKYSIMPREEVVPHLESLDLSFCNAYTSWDKEEETQEGSEE